MPVKSTFFLRSSVVVMDAMIASYFLARSAGMMPSQSCLTSVHSAFRLAYKALAISMSKPFISPSGVISLKNG